MIRIGTTISLILIFFGVSAAYGQSAKAPPPIQWLKQDDRGRVLGISLLSFLNAKQREIINSGFTVQSLTSLRWDKKDELPAAQKICTVKYDTWNETYQVMILGGDRPAFATKLLDEFALKCLTLEIMVPHKTAIKQGQAVFIRVQMSQVSEEESKKMKNWLVKQQGSLIQGLFSHMLDNLSSSLVIDERLLVP